MKFKTGSEYPVNCGHKTGYAASRLMDVAEAIEYHLGSQSGQYCCFNTELSNN